MTNIKTLQQQYRKIYKNKQIKKLNTGSGGLTFTAAWPHTTFRAHAHAQHTHRHKLTQHTHT